jgi:hypothetical protein
MARWKHRVVGFVPLRVVGFVPLRVVGFVPLRVVGFVPLRVVGFVPLRVDADALFSIAQEYFLIGKCWRCPHDFATKRNVGGIQDMGSVQLLVALATHLCNHKISLFCEQPISIGLPDDEGGSCSKCSL